MRKVLSVFLVCLTLFGCAKKTNDNALFSTFNDWVEAVKDKEEQPMLVIEDDKVYGIAEKDGRYYQITGKISSEKQKELDALDFFADDYEQKKNDIVRDIKADDVLDFTDKILSQSQLDAYAGKPVRTLAEEGFENTGWSVGEEDGTLFYVKDEMEYNVEFELPADFDIEAEFNVEDMYDCKIIKMVFAAPTFAAIPIK